MSPKCGLLVFSFVDGVLDSGYSRFEFGYVVSDGVGQRLVEFFAIDTLAVDSDNATGYADYRCIRRNFAENDRAGADFGTRTDSERTEYLCARTDHHIVLDGGVTFSFVFAGAAQRYALIYYHIIADHGGLADDYARAVIDKHSAPDVSAGMYFDSGEKAGETRKNARSEKISVHIQKMKEPVRYKRVKPAVTQRRFELVARGGIVTNYRIQIAFYCRKSTYRFHCTRLKNAARQSFYTR